MYIVRYLAIHTIFNMIHTNRKKLTRYQCTYDRYNQCNYATNCIV